MLGSLAIDFGKLFDTRSEALLGWRRMNDCKSQAKANRTNRGAQGIAQKCAGQESLCPWNRFFAVVLQQRYQFFWIECGKCGNLVVDTMSYRRTKICLMLSWDVLVGMLPMRHGRSNSLKLQFMACCSCGDFTIKISSTVEGGPECFRASD